MMSRIWKHPTVEEDANILVACRKCNAEYPRTQKFFHPDKTCLFGLRKTCRKCINAYNVALRVRMIGHYLGVEQAARDRNTEHRRAVNRSRYYRLRWEALLYYSGGGSPLCSCCGEHEYEFLSIDHINGGGSKQRRDDKCIGAQFYFWLKKNGYPVGFRVLCHNCNQAIGYYGVCPHERRRLASIAKPDQPTAESGHELVN
jgi:hypothetical protein